MEEIQETQELLQQKKFSPFYRLIALISAIALFLLSLEGYFYLFHPEPNVKITLKDIQSFIPSDLKGSFTSYSDDELRKIIAETSDPIKQVANVISSDSCRRSDSLCESKALFYFVRDHITYVPDPKFDDKLENPLMTLKTGGADCEDMAVLISVLEKAIGNDSRLVFIPGHVYAQVRIPDYKDSWLDLEATCKICNFNQVPDELFLDKKEYVLM